MSYPTTIENPPFLFWCDLETTGLEPNKDRILEIAWRLTSFTYPYPRTESPGVDSFSCTVKPLQSTSVAAIRARSSPEVQALHDASGLWVDLEEDQAGIDLDMIERDLLALSATWPLTRDAGPKVMLAGFSTHFDLGFLRAHMPAFASRLHYRVFDVSAVREFCRSFGMPHGPKKDATHRAWADLQVSIQTAKECAVWLRTTCSPFSP